MKRGQMNQKVNKILVNKFREAGITRCEVCGSTEWLTWMHRKKRRYYSTVEEMSDFNQVILACIICHQRLEFDRKATEELFIEKRG